MRALIAAMAALLAAPAAAGADPPWSPPRAVSTLTGFPAPGIAFGTDGAALLSWNTADRAHVATLAAGGAIVQRGRLPGALVAKPLVTGRDRTVILTRTRRVTRQFRTLDRLTATFGTTSRPRGRSRRVAAYEAAGEDQGPAVAASGDEVAVAWVELLPRERHRIRVAVSRGGRAFGRPVTLATTALPTRDSQSVALAYGPRRELIAAYSTARRRNGTRPVIAVRTRRPRHRFSRARIIGERQPLCDLVAAASPRGRVVVAWASQDSGEEASRPWVVRAALRPARGRAFAPAAVIDPGETRARVPGRLAAAIARDGTTTLAWTNVKGDSFPLRTATALPDGAFGAAAEVTPNGIVGGLAVDAGGATLLSWTELVPAGLSPLPPPPGLVFAALRPAGATGFPGWELVSDRRTDDQFPAVGAFDPRSGRPTVVWPAVLAPGAVRLQLSTRAG